MRASPITLYGIAACDTVRKARVWLEQRGIDYDFHDYKKAGVDAERLSQWVDEHGWETVLNRAGTTFKKLSDLERTHIDKSKAIKLMMAQPSMIKRPVLDIGHRRLVGFKPEIYADAQLNGELLLPKASNSSNLLEHGERS